MNTYLAVAAILIQAVRADYKSGGATLKSAADKLNSAVTSFDKSQGVNGAISVQLDFPALLNAVRDLKGQINGDDSIDVEGTKGFGGAVVQLLDNLAKKAGDFEAVSTTKIVQDDLTNVSGPAAELVSGIVSAITSDCEKVSALNPVLTSLDAAFKSAASAYKIQPPNFPPPIKCGNGAGSASSAASSSEPAATSSAAASAAPSSSAAKPEESSAAPAAKSSVPVKVSNSAGKNVVGAAAAVAGAAALLL